jgi:hypothetical protein
MKENGWNFEASTSHALPFPRAARSVQVFGDFLEDVIGVAG